MNNPYMDRLMLEAIETYGDTIYKLALHYVRNAADAEDVVQEVLLTYIRHKPDASREKSWFLRVTVNKCLNLLKRRRHEVQTDDVLTDRQPPPMSADLYDALNSLSTLDRKIVFLFFHAGYSSKEIGKILHKTDSAVRKRLERAKKQLRKYLEEP